MPEDEEEGYVEERVIDHPLELLIISQVLMIPSWEVTGRVQVDTEVGLLPPPVVFRIQLIKVMAHFSLAFSPTEI